MKKFTVLLILIGILAFISCKDIEIFYPIPLTVRAKFPITATNGRFADSLFISTDSLYDDLKGEIEKAGLSWDDLDRIRLEGAAYIVYDPSDPSTVVDGQCDIRYPLTTPFEQILTLDNVNLGDIEGIPQKDPLTIQGVRIVNQVWDDFLLQVKAFPGSSPILLIGVKAEGSLSTQNRVTFTMIVDFTVTAVVRTKQKKYDIFG